MDEVVIIPIKDKEIDLFPYLDLAPVYQLEQSGGNLSTQLVSEGTYIHKYLLSKDQLDVSKIPNFSTCINYEKGLEHLRKILAESGIIKGRILASGRRPDMQNNGIFGEIKTHPGEGYRNPQTSIITDSRLKSQLISYITNYNTCLLLDIGIESYGYGKRMIWTFFQAILINNTSKIKYRKLCRAYVNKSELCCDNQVRTINNRHCKFYLN